MNIPSIIDVKLPSIILESDSSNNAIWGQIYGGIDDQEDLIDLIEESTPQVDWDETDTESKAYILNKPSIDVNDSSVTVQKNGETVSSFTLNQNYNQIINIELEKDDVGLGNVDNTSDEDKPLSQAAADAINAVDEKVDEIISWIPSDTAIGNRLVNEDMLIPSMAVPDYSNAETTNRIASSGLSWVVTKNGYVKCNGISNSSFTFEVRVDGEVFHSITGTSQITCTVTVPVAAGNTVMLYGGSSVGCFYIPPKIVALV
jgi:riboflavin synthase alpha subunit